MTRSPDAGLRLETLSSHGATGQRFELARARNFRARYTFVSRLKRIPHFDDRRYPPPIAMSFHALIFGGALELLPRTSKGVLFPTQLRQHFSAEQVHDFVQQARRQAAEVRHQIVMVQAEPLVNRRNAVRDFSWTAAQRRPL